MVSHFSVDYVDEGAARSLRRVGRRVHAQLPFRWVAEVWAKGLPVVDDRFCLSAVFTASEWSLETVTRELSSIERIGREAHAA